MKKTILIIVLAVLGMTQAVAQEDGYLPLVREGVKWVNEKVIVNHGDTTCYYYNYEFSGKYYFWYDLEEEYLIRDACYYYIGDQLDVEKDSLIAGMRDSGVVLSLYNYAYGEMFSSFRTMINYPIIGAESILYCFVNFYNYSGAGLYINCQDHQNPPEPFMSTENFFEVEPLTIEGESCSRYAYIGEDGDTLAYVVEGIGFDSRDLGDLLTPFTRKPDPDADYQEWCGLSHVVKDGQIIYKGMRYREGVHVGVDEVVADRNDRPLDPNYYNLMGQPVGKEVPTAPGIYIHQGKKILIGN
jgi:hypothetical protein